MAGPKAVSCGIEAKNLPKGKLVVLGRLLYALIFLFVVPATSRNRQSRTRLRRACL